ncbi:MAG TPA: TIR domain-containing protein [Ktedonobacteraceae bacterium]
MPKPLQSGKQPVTIFYSYASQDEQLFRELQKQLAPLRLQYGVSEWDRSQIGAGMDWHQEINRQLDRSAIILLLVSADFLNSSACYREMLRALERERRGDVRVIPVILRPVDWPGALFAHLHSLPSNKLPVTQWPDQDAALKHIASGIRAVAEDLLHMSPSPAPLPPFPLPPDGSWRIAGLARSNTKVRVGIILLSLFLALACVSSIVLARFVLEKPGPSPSAFDMFPALSNGEFIFDQGQVPVQWKVDAQHDFMHKNAGAAIADWKMAIDENPSDAESHIYWQDQQIIQAGQPYVTVVALINLVPDDLDYAQPGRSRDILQGIALVQDEFNKAHADLKVCVLIANVNIPPQSPSFDVAFNNVVQQIIKAAGSSTIYQHIVGVVGWPFNGNRNVLQQLANNQLTVISSIAPDKDLPGTRGFLSVAPSLQAEAQTAMDYINVHWREKPVYFLEDEDDPYSKQLGDAFYQASGNTAQLIMYSVGRDCRAPGVCNTLNPYLSDNGNAVIYFAGYPNDARFILDKLRSLPNINVIGGDVLSQMVNTPRQYPGVFNGLYYTSFAFHETVHNQNFGQNFSRDYQQLFNAQRASPLCYYTCVLASNDTILAYDAALVLTQTTLRARKDDALPTIADVWGALDGSGFIPIQGASGLLSFTRDGTLARKDAVLVLHVDDRGFTQIG